MAPRADGRFCDRCSRTVVDLTGVTAAEADAMFERAGGDLCGQVYADPSGETYFPIQRGRLEALAALGLAVLSACVSPGTAAASDAAEVTEASKSGPETVGVASIAAGAKTEPEPAPTPPTPTPTPRPRPPHPRPPMRGRLHRG